MRTPAVRAPRARTCWPPSRSSTPSIRRSRPPIASGSSGSGTKCARPTTVTAFPRALLHGNLLHAPDHAVLSDHGPVAINWKASGRGPRLADFAYLIWGTGSWNPRRPNQERSTLPSTPTAGTSSRPTTSSTGSRRSCTSGRSTSPASATDVPGHRRREVHASGASSVHPSTSAPPRPQPEPRSAGSGGGRRQALHLRTSTGVERPAQAAERLAGSAQLGWRRPKRTP